MGVEAMSFFGKESIVKKSDSSRMFGWWVSVDGKRVASLESRAWDTNSQFWHIYEVIKISKEFSKIGLDQDRWCDSSVTIQNRYVTDFEERSVLMSPRGGNLIALRDLSVPASIFIKAGKDNQC